MSAITEARERLDLALLKGEAEWSCEYEEADGAVYDAARELLILLDAADQADEGACGCKMKTVCGLKPRQIIPRSDTHCCNCGHPAACHKESPRG